MNKLDLQQLGVCELTSKELVSVDGGRDWIDHIKSAYATLTNDLAGTIFVAAATPIAMGCILVGGTANWAIEKCRESDE